MLNEMKGSSNNADWLE